MHRAGVVADIADLFCPPEPAPEPPLLAIDTMGHTSPEPDGSPVAAAPAEDPAELRRKRNRESMRRVRLRKRDARINMQQLVRELEGRLQLLMARNERAAQQLAVANDGGSWNRSKSKSRSESESESGDQEGAPTLPELLSETATLSYANKALRDRITQHQAAEAALARIADDERLQQQAQAACAELSADADVLRPLLAWLTPAHLSDMIALACHKIRANRALVESLVPRPNNALGWSDQRCVDGNMARYVMRKTFHQETLEGLAAKTWATIVDIEKLAQVMRWAKGMKVLHWLSPDAAVVTRELSIPNPSAPEFNTQFRFTLLVFRARTPDGGYCLGTINLNIFGTSVAECLAKDASYMGGVHAHTMYGWTFTPARDAQSGDVVGCEVELAGLTGNGTLAYARNVLMEMITVVLLWEHAFVATIRLLGS